MSDPQHSEVNIRVYKRGYAGTILIWNMHPLSEEQKKRENLAVYVKRPEDKDWWVPKLGMPDKPRMGKALELNNDTITIVHDEKIDPKTGFDLRLVFGGGTDGYYEAKTRIEPSNSYKPFVKPERTIMNSGKVKYVNPVKVIAMEDEVVERIAEATARKIRGK